MSEMMQSSFYFNLVPTLAVQKGKPTRHWHRIEKPEDAFERPEWACLTYLQQRSQPAGINSQVDLVSGVATVSLGQMCADLCMANSSLHRTLDRLEKMGLIKLTKRGRSRKQPSNWTIFNYDAVREAILTSQCTHYCMQGSARKLYQAEPNPQS
jgi:hypothetical protein